MQLGSWGVGADLLALTFYSYLEPVSFITSSTNGVRPCEPRNRVLERAYRNKPLTAEQKAVNRINSSVRSIVERVFGVLKLHYGMNQARYLGLNRNKASFGLMSLAYNIKRGASIQRSTLQATG